MRRRTLGELLFAYGTLIVVGIVVILGILVWVL